jgi:hypothetical protein
MANKYAILVLPLLYSVAIWALFINTPFFLDTFPSLPFLHFTKTVHDVLPVHPEGMVQAFRFGQLDGEMLVYEKQPDLYSTEMDGILKEASSLAGRPISLNELHAIGVTIAEMEKEQGLVQRVKGLFSFINLVWLLSIGGIMLAIGPVLFIIAAPVVRMLAHIFTDVIIPILIALQPLYEVLAYLLCFFFVLSGLRFPTDTGFYISLTGCIGLLPSFSYTTYHFF